MKYMIYSTIGLALLAFNSIDLEAAEIRAATTPNTAITQITDPIQNTNITKSPWQQSYILEAKGDYKSASDTLAPYLNNTESSEMGWLRQGWLHYLQGNYNDAISAYQKAWKKNKYSLDARLGLTLPLMAQHRWAEAARYAQQVIDVSHWNYTAHLRLLVCHQGLNNWHQVDQLAQKLTKRYPSETTPLIYLARARNRLGDVEGAVTAYRQVLMREPGNIEAGQFVVN